MAAHTTTVRGRDYSRSPYLRKLALAKDPSVRAAVWCAFNAPVPVACLQKQILDGTLDADLLEALSLVSSLQKAAGHRKLLNERSGGSRYNNATISEAWRVLVQHGESISGLARQLDLPDGTIFDTARKKMDERVRRVGFAFEGRGRERRMTHGPCTHCEEVYPSWAIYPHAWLCDDCHVTVNTEWNFRALEIVA